ncbi:MAG: hypothetical protein RRZ24_09840 [Clostridia bacterium]
MRNRVQVWLAMLLSGMVLAGCAGAAAGTFNRDTSSDMMAAVTSVPAKTQLVKQTQTFQPEDGIKLTQMPLLAYMRRMLHESTRSIFLQEELDMIPFLVIDGIQLNALDEVVYFSNLESLTLRNTAVIDLTPLTKISGLNTLTLENNHEMDLSTLPKMDGLTVLTLKNNDLMDAAVLQSVKNLQSLSIDQTLLPDQSALDGLTKLTELSLRWDRLKQNAKLDAIGTLPALRKLTLAGGAEKKPRDYAFLSSLKNLEELSVTCNSVDELQTLPKLPCMKRLELAGNLDGVLPLEKQTQLTALTLNTAHVRSVKPLTKLRGLTELTLLNCSAADLDVLADMPWLKVLAVTGKGILKPLAKLSEQLPNTRIETTRPK